MAYFTGGCSKSQSYGASTSMVGPSHSASTTAAALPHTSPTSASHKLPCSTKQLGIAGCLNGGSCFTLELHNSSSTVTVAHCRSVGLYSYIGLTYAYTCLGMKTIMRTRSMRFLSSHRRRPGTEFGGDGKNIFADKKFQMAYFRKKFPFSRQKFLMTFFPHRLFFYLFPCLT